MAGDRVGGERPDRPEAREGERPPPPPPPPPPPGRREAGAPGAPGRGGPAAVSFPIPELAPVTMHTRPAIGAATRSPPTVLRLAGADQEPAHGVARDDAVGGLDVRPEELLEELLLHRARLPVRARNREDRTVVLEELERALPRGPDLRHVPTLVADPGEGPDPLLEALVLHLGPVLRVHLLGPLLQERGHGVRAELLLDEREGGEGHLRVRLR